MTRCAIAPHPFRLVAATLALVGSALGLVALVPLAAASGAVGDLTVLGSLVTVKAGDPTPAGPSAANVSLARNEFESFQVAVPADADGIAHLSVDTADLTGPGGATMPASALTVYREQYFHVAADHLSDGESSVGDWPDALVPQVDPIYGQRREAFSTAVPAGGRAVIWVDVLAGREQAPGTYTGVLRVKDGTTILGNVPLQVTVRDILLPSTSSLDSVFPTEPTNECQAHTGSGTCNNSPAEANRLSALYERVALENRISLSTPWQIDRGAALSGTMRDEWRRQVLPIINGTAAPASVGSPIRLPGARATDLVLWHYCKQACLDAWKAEAAADGFADRISYYTCDEPNQDAARWQACNDNHAVAASRDMRELVTTPMQLARAHGAESWIDDMVVLTRMMDGRSGTFGGSQRSQYDGWAGDGTDGHTNKVWIYSSCESAACNDPGQDGWNDPFYNGWGGYGIDQPASQARALAWTAFAFDATGELYWGTDYRLGQAWNRCGAGGTGCLYESGMNGDATLFYPGRACPPGTGVGCIGGTTDIPIESIRLKRIRDGREDYEYLHLAASHPATADLAHRTAVQLLGGAIDAAAYSATFSQGALDTARGTLADAIQGDGSTPPPTATPTPTPSPTPTSGPAALPDAMVRRSGSASFVGDDVHNSTGAGQTVKVTLRRGGSARFTVRIVNDGTAVDQWSLAEARSGVVGMTRTWSASGIDVTRAVAAGTFAFRDVVPGAGRTVILRVAASPRTRLGQVATWYLHAVHNPLGDGIRDVVRIQVRVVA